MNFFERQAGSRSMTRRLVALFAVAVVAIVLSVYTAIRAAGFFYYDRYTAERYAARRHAAPPPFTWFHRELFVWVAGITVAVIGLGTLQKIRALRGGGGYVAERLGGKLLWPDTTDRLERRLFNVVEEMSIASGVPVPLVYVMDREDSINAFAAGYEPAGAVIAVTRSCLTTLTRDELQGVIAHEFSHILSGDMRLNIRLIGLLGGILSIAVIGTTLTRGVRGRGSAPVALTGLALLVIGYAGVFFGRIIQCAVSRQREHLADASAVQFTRNPAGLAGALKKIGGFAGGSRIAAPAAAETSHMFFARAVAGLFSTHPPLVERIRLLEPGFSGTFPAVTGAEAAAPEAGQAALHGELPVAMAAGAVSASVGELTPERMSRGRQLLARIPEKLKAALGSPAGAFAAVCCLLLDADPAKRGEQLRKLRAAAPQPLMIELRGLAPVVAGLAADMRLPVLDLALPALRLLSPRQHEELMACVRLLITADQTITLYEFCLHTILTRRLVSAAGAPAPQQMRLGRPEFLSHAVHILAALAHAGGQSHTAAQEAFAAGAACLRTTEAPAPLPPSPPGFACIGRALQRCAAAPAAMKQELLDACAHCALHDAAVSQSEAELLRAVAYCLDLPLPPFLPAAQAGLQTAARADKQSGGSQRTPPER